MLPVDLKAIFQNYAQAMQTGISKVMAKMGISTLQSYKGAQIFEAVGLAEDVIEKAFKGTPSRLVSNNSVQIAFGAFSYFLTLLTSVFLLFSIFFYRLGGVSLEMLAAEAFERHSNAYRVNPDSLILRDPGIYHWRAGGEKHLNEPASIAALQVKRKLE